MSNPMGSTPETPRLDQLTGFPSSSNKIFIDSLGRALGFPVGDEIIPFPGWYRMSCSFDLWLMAAPKNETGDVTGIYVPIADFPWNFWFDVNADFNQTIPDRWYYIMLGDHSASGVSNDTHIFPEWDTDHK